MNTLKISVQYISWETLDYTKLINLTDYEKFFIFHYIIDNYYTMINNFPFKKRDLIMDRRSFKDFLKCLKLFDYAKNNQCPHDRYCLTEL